jgi:hypothetical protein
MNVENDDDDLIEDNPVDVETDEVCAPAACSIKEAEPKVRFVLR